MILQELRQELKKNIDPAYRESIKRFFKDDQKIAVYGVRIPIVRKIAASYFPRIKQKSKDEIFRMCEEMWASGIGEEKTIASLWISRLESQFSPSDFKFFESWLRKYVANWGACDVLCGYLFGPFILKFPEFMPKIKNWTKSKNRWVRRAAAVVMIVPVRKKKFLEDAFEIADLLFLDKDDMVQKGYGWMLKEASNVYPKEVFDYVMERKANMPRTALRYAIEKMPSEWKKKAMARD